MKKAVIIFTRKPIAGQTKTRMMPALTPEECEKLHKSFLKDIKHETEKIDTDIFVAYTPVKDKLLEILGKDKNYFSQSGKGLGEKMYNAIKTVLDKGYEACVLIGTDIPEITEKQLKNAFVELQYNDIVFGGTKDGGYYLVGMKKPIKETFENQVYGKGSVLENTVSLLEEKSFKIGYVTTLSDIDTVEDLREYRKRVLENKELQQIESGRFVLERKEISIIIPVYNEESTIENLQKQLYNVKDKCEIIFVDGGSKDNTVSLIDKGYKVIQSKKGRANQMNLGADVSSGDTLFFLHSDSKLPENFLEEILKVREKYVVGLFGIKFKSKNFFMLTNRVISNFRGKYRKIIFGDQGMFIKRDLFFKVGGFPNLPIMEDYQFSLTLKEQNKKVGITKHRILTSDRRYPKGTIPKLKLMWKMYNLRKMYRNKVDINEISKMYRDIR